MESLPTLAGRLDEAVVTLTTAVAATAPAGLTDFGADAPGRLGELGRALCGQWAATLDARMREASIAAELLTEAAATLRVASGSYAEVDHAAGRRQAEES
ncbi:MAG TPA: hypothetical protein VFX61_00310 [Micromonosporaceae bacterium]|nr:hypothetical protein [Micromonosporaceae bacterium]